MAENDGNNVRFIIVNTTTLTFKVIGLIALFGDFDVDTGHEFGPGEESFLLHGSQSVGTIVCCDREVPAQIWGVSASNVKDLSKKSGEFCTVSRVKIAISYTGGPTNPSCRVTLSAD